MGFWGTTFAILFALTAAIATLIIRRSRMQLAALAKEHFITRNALRKAEEALKDSQHWAEVLRMVSDSASDRLILVDRELRVLFINQAARALFGAERENIIPSHTLITITHRHELEDVVNQTFSDQDMIQSQISQAGRTYAIITEYIHLGLESLVLLIIQDVSEIQRLGRARREMVANISHELRTPLTSIRLLIDTIKRTPTLDSETDRLVERIAAETDTLGQLAEELLDLSMIEAGRAEFIFKPERLRPMVDEVIAHLQEQAGRKEIILVNEIPEELEALCDQSQIARVVKNLTHNAIKFSPDGGKITLNAGLSGEGQVSVSIMDQGVGIPDSEKERVFERFYRGDRSRNTPGTGLGLSIAKHIIQAHGGSIRVEDGSAGVGARFVFTLPARM